MRDRCALKENDADTQGSMGSWQRQERHMDRPGSSTIVHNAIGQEKGLEQILPRAF
jgi:hypothetical protein